MKSYTVVGLTGQSGAGKTMVSDVFKREGFSIIDCDKVARNVTSDGSECNIALSKFFPTCFDEKYKLDRKALANIVFNDKQKLKTLDDVIFPFITRDIENIIKEYVNNNQKYILLDAPTLFEAGIDKLCDFIVSCVADENVRTERIKERDNISIEQIQSRFSSQKSEKFFYDSSDYIIKNNGDINNAVVQTINIIRIIKGTINEYQKKN